MPAQVSGPNIPADLGLITLLNADYKILASIIANRLRPMMPELLQPSKFCGVPGKTIFGTVATARKAIAQARYDAKASVRPVLSLSGCLRRIFPSAYLQHSETQLFQCLVYKMHRVHVRDCHILSPNELPHCQAYPDEMLD